MLMRCLASALLFVCSMIALAHASEGAHSEAEAALRRGDHSAIVKALLPLYKRGELRDARGLYLLSRGCFLAKPSPFVGALAVLDRSCTRQSGAVTRRAAQAGSVDAMLDLAYTLYRPNRHLAHPDLRPDLAQAYGWSLLAASLAREVEQAQRARVEVERLRVALRSIGEPRASRAMKRAEEEAAEFFLRLAPEVRPDLVPADGRIADSRGFHELGWSEIPGTADVSEMKEGPDLLYLPTLRDRDGRAMFHVSLNDVDTWRIARMEADCSKPGANILDDTGWQGYGEGDETAVAPLRPVARARWAEDAAYVKMVVDFACSKLPVASAPAS